MEKMGSKQRGKIRGQWWNRWSGIFLLLLAVPSLALSGCSFDSSTVQAKKIIQYHEEKYKDADPSGTVIDGVRVITLKAYQFYFSPSTIVANKGDRVRLVVSAEDVPHGFEIEGLKIPGYNIETVIRPGFPVAIEFTADERGVWEIICTIYCGFGHSGMKGTFVVK